MTLMQVTYELQRPLRDEDLKRLAGFANTYGLKRFHFDWGRNHLVIEYDGSRLKETEVENVLRVAKIAVVRRVDPFIEPAVARG